MVGEAAEDGMSRREVTWAVIAMLTGFFAAMLAMNIVITALPVIVGELQGTQIQYSWVLAATLLANASSTPVWGKLADMLSKKALFQVANLIFLLGSLVAGLAPNMETLIVGRFIQGISLGGINALALAILGTIIAPRERAKYISYIGVCLALGSAGGPLLGGLTVETLGWRWCFFITVPFSLFALTLIHRTLHVPPSTGTLRIDYMGVLLLVTTSSLLLMWFSFAGTPGYFPWWSWESGAVLATAAILLLFFVVVERRVREPLIALHMLQSRTTFLAVVGTASIAVCLTAMPVFLGQYFQIGRGLTPTESGLMVLPLLLGNLIGGLGTGRLITRFGRWKIYLVFGSFLLTSSMFVLATVGGETDLRFVFVVLICAGLGLGAQMNNLMLVVQDTVKAAQVGQASSLVTFSRFFSGGAAASILGSVMSVQVAGLSVADANGSSGSDVYAEGSATLFLVAACITVPSVLTSLLFKERPLRNTI